MKAVVSVINDLVTDQRVHRTCTTLHEMGYEVLLVGRRKRDSLPMPARPYATHRMKLPLEKGPGFYFVFQLRLLFFLLRNKADVYVANDLDTLWPNSLAARFYKRPLVYDTHEIFTEVPELAQGGFKKSVWKWLERRLFRKLKYVFTVNDSIADWYDKKYGIRPRVVRNIPRIPAGMRAFSRADVHLPENKKIVLLQGAGINVHRGAEEAVEAMKFLDGVVLLIIGGGDVLPKLKEMAQTKHLEGKVIFVDKLPPDELRAWTRLADLGLTLDKDSNINYRYSLPNKIFDYIHAGIPVLASDLVEVKKIIEAYQVGRVISTHDPYELAVIIREMLGSTDYVTWKKNTDVAAGALTWENEEEKLRDVFSRFL